MMITAGLHKDWREVPTTAEDGWRWPHFTARELACKCGKHCKGAYFHDARFLDMLEALREVVGRPLTINSGHRCRLHNAAVKGAPLSQHRKVAVDISVRDWPDADRRALMLAARRLGFGGIGYATTFLHLDPRPLKANGRPAQWDYQTGGMARWASLTS